MQVNSKTLTNILCEILQQNDFFEGVRLLTHVDDSFEFVKQVTGTTFRLGGRFLYHVDGYELNNFFQIIQVDEIESFVEPILTENGLKHNSNDTFILGTKMREDTDVFKRIWDLRINDSRLTEFKELLTKCVNETIVPFCIEYANTEKITKTIENVDFAELINSELRGEYPSNYFKAIYLFDKYGLEHKRKDYLKNLALWIEEDKSDPNYGHLYENYKNGYKDLKERLNQ